ncbi:MAG TPA: damage-control phosphatase ARMT1 family protein [Polyangiaceae bacterium]|nr:damage-control phosphatase ARMT1 family protein [Polyangiaceae bacterium]
MPPPPLRTDPSNAFAHYSMTVRVPKILDDVREENADYPAAILDAVARLGDEIRSDARLPPLGFPAPDAAEWEPELGARTWLQTEWFFAECYLYRSLMAAVRYWEQGRDPFAPVKRRELASEALWQGLEAVVAHAAQGDELVHALLDLSLWGNRIDLSYAVGTAFGRAGESHDLLCDDRDRALSGLLRRGGDVHLVADNTGSELSMDLALADVLMSSAGARVSLHVKMHPVFVSDAIVADVWSLVDAMRARGGRLRDLGLRLVRAFDAGQLRVLPDFYWNGPCFLWDRPPRIAAELDRATMVIFKGDANYRRVIGDALWPPEATLGEATRYFPAPVLLLRTMKSDAVVGLPHGLAAQLDAVDADWRINARRGLIQRGGRDT